MSTLEAETDIKNTVQSTEAVEIIDCGRVSECTQGGMFFVFTEPSTPPLNKLFT